MNFAWHITANKIYSRTIWEKALVEYKKVTKHLIMTEDVAFSNVVFYYAKKVTKVDRVAFFYTKHSGASTSINDITFKKVCKNLDDLTTSFSFVENFLKEKNVYEKYKENLKNGELYTVKSINQYLCKYKIYKEEKAKLEKKFKEFLSKTI